MEKTGISNRKTAEEEQREREQHPLVDAGPAQPEGGPVVEGVLVGEYQTSHKAGSRSLSQKEAGSRYPDRSTPQSHKVGGAFGAEPTATEAEAETPRNGAPQASRGRHGRRGTRTTP